MPIIIAGLGVIRFFSQVLDGGVRAKSLSTGSCGNNVLGKLGLRSSPAILLTQKSERRLVCSK